jgi:HD-GYP domain-containing protein (c-di-GMP phosphodiesterase class II)
MSDNEHPDYNLNFKAIRVSTLRGERKIPFNAYIKIGERHVLYCRKGDSFEGSRLERLRSKNLEKLYILESEIEKYDKYIQDNIDEAFDLQSKLDLFSRSVVIQGHQQAMSEEVMEHPEIEEHYSIAKSSCFRFVDFMNKNDLALKCLLSIQNDQKSLSHHGINVSGISLGISKHLHRQGFVMDQPELMCLGAMIHDLGRLDLSFDSRLTLSELTPDQAEEYRKHPSQGMAKIRTLRHFDEIVSQIINDHEEFIDGSGYPQGLTEKHINPYTLIVSVANTYDKLISFEKKSTKDALKFMIIDSMGLHPLDMMKALQSSLKVGGIV